MGLGWGDQPCENNSFRMFSAIPLYPTHVFALETVVGPEKTKINHGRHRSVFASNFMRDPLV